MHSRILSSQPCLLKTIVGHRPAFTMYRSRSHVQGVVPMFVMRPLIRLVRRSNEKPSESLFIQTAASESDRKLRKVKSKSIFTQPLRRASEMPKPV
jgi:hypothetical protein